ncbi:hypothetical protein C2S51_009028 [Perilla frutescens var. frutescens]|nr:hypothetical protein C2S51_009028 [Perilla frutescens var. frutescens]
MAKQGTIGLILIISYLSVLTAGAYAKKQGRSGYEETNFLRDICGGKEKVVRLRCYVHDLRVGNENPTVYTVATASITPNSPTSFGSINVVDDLVTAEPSINSTEIGRIQGLTTSADLSVNGVALNLNVYFTAGRFNGSTISILGRNQVMNPHRELPVAGGTGAFRFARGYAYQTTYSYDTVTSYAVMEFNIYTTYNSKFNVLDNFDIDIAQI